MGSEPEQEAERDQTLCATKLYSCSPRNRITTHGSERHNYNSGFSYNYLDSPTQVITIPVAAVYTLESWPLHMYCLSPAAIDLCRVEITSRLGMRGSSSLLLLSSALQTVLLKLCCFTLLLHKSIFVRTNKPGQFRLTCQSIFLHCTRRILMKNADAKNFSSCFHVYGYSAAKHDPNHRSRHFQRMLRRILCCPSILSSLRPCFAQTNNRSLKSRNQ